MKRTITIEPDSAGVPCDWALRVMTELEALNAAVRLEKFSFERLANPASPPTYLYTIKAIDGRTWKQTITMNPNEDPVMTFDVSGTWRKSEINHWSVRDCMLHCASTHPDVTLVKVLFT